MLIFSLFFFFFHLEKTFSPSCKNFLPNLIKILSLPFMKALPSESPSRSLPIHPIKPINPIIFLARLYIIRYVIFPVPAHEALFYVVEHIFFSAHSHAFAPVFCISPKNILQKFCQFGNKQYLCIRFRKESAVKEAFFEGFT